jgi:hypothetical protein
MEEKDSWWSYGDSGLNTLLNKKNNLASFIGGEGGNDINTYSVARKCLDVINKTQKKVIIDPSHSINRKDKTIVIKADYRIKKPDAIVGQIIHDFEIATNSMKSPYSGDSTEHSIKNLLYTVIEEERLDTQLLKTYPGYKIFLDSFKEFQYKNSFSDNYEGALNKVIDLIKAIRYNEMISSDINSTIINKCKNILYENEPIQPKDSVLLSEKLYKILCDELKENNQGSQDNQHDKDSQYGQGSSDSQDTHNNQDNQDSQDKSDVLLDRKSIMKINILSQKLNNNKLTSFEVKKIFSKLTKNEIERELVKILTGDEMFTLKNDTKFVKARGTDDVLYNSIKNKIRPHIGRISRKIRNMETDLDLTLRSMKSGKFDENKLVDAYLGKDAVYIKKGYIQKQEVNICIAIDESGSMNNDNKMDKARESAILLYEALKQSKNVNLFIYGYTSQGWSNETEITIYVENSKEVKKFALSALTYKQENIDGIAFYSIHDRVSSMVNKDYMMLIISDGQPSAPEYRGIEAINHTKDCVRLIRKSGVIVKAIAIGGDMLAMKNIYEDDSNDNSFIIINEISNLPDKVVSLFNGYFKRKFKRIIKI